MPALGLLPGTVRRTRGGLPSLPLVNMFSEAAITEPTQFALQSRKGLVDSGITLGAGPVRALFAADGVLSGVTVGLSGSDLYVDGVSKGTVNGTGFASIAGNQMGVAVTRGQDANFYDGVSFRNIAFPDNAYMTKIIEQGGRFIGLRSGSHRYYWTQPLANMLDGSGDMVFDGLDYASAESEPDQLVDAVVFQDHLVLGGLSTIELHGETGNDNAPWSPTVGQTIAKGVKQAGCLTLWSNAFAWVSPENVVYRYDGGGGTPVSNPGIEELIAASSICELDSFYTEGRELLRARLDNVDLCLSANTGEWEEWDTAGQTGFVGGPVIFGPVFGSKIDGTLYDLTENNELALPMVKTFRAGIPIDGGQVVIGNVVLRTNPGQIDGGTVEMRFSRDSGNTFSDWVEVSMGDVGDYRQRIEWRSLGLFDQPGALFEFRHSDDCEFRASGALFNENMKGRA